MLPIATKEFLNVPCERKCYASNEATLLHIGYRVWVGGSPSTTKGLMLATMQGVGGRQGYQNSPEGVVKKFFAREG